VSTCTDNPRIGIIGCGQTYGGEMQHSVARVPWSTHPDGLAHITARLTNIELCWAKGDSAMADPATVGLEPNDRGVWRMPMSDEDRDRLADVRHGSGVRVSAQSDETAPLRAPGADTPV
jgi:hypothetical protein